MAPKVNCAKTLFKGIPLQTSSCHLSKVLLKKFKKFKMSLNNYFRDTRKLYDFNVGILFLNYTNCTTCGLENFLSVSIKTIVLSKTKINTICIRHSRSLLFCKKVDMKNFIKFIGKNLYRSLFRIKMYPHSLQLN